MKHSPFWLVMKPSVKQHSNNSASTLKDLLPATIGSSVANTQSRVNHCWQTIRIWLQPRRPSGTWFISLLLVYALRGVTAPGLPGVIIGHNDRIAWELHQCRIQMWRMFILEKFDTEQSTAIPDSVRLAGCEDSSRRDQSSKGSRRLVS